MSCWNVIFHSISIFSTKTLLSIIDLLKCFCPKPILENDFWSRKNFTLFHIMYLLMSELKFIDIELRKDNYLCQEQNFVLAYLCTELPLDKMPERELQIKIMARHDSIIPWVGMQSGMAIWKILMMGYNGQLLYLVIIPSCPLNEVIFGLVCALFIRPGIGLDGELILQN